MSSIKRTHDGWHIYDAPALGLIGTWALSAYGYLIKLNETVTFAEFALRIKSTYSLDNSRNKMAYDWFMHEVSNEA